MSPWRRGCQSACTGRQGDPRERLLQIVDLMYRRLRRALFRPPLEEPRGPPDRANGARPSFDAVAKLEMLYPMGQHGRSFEQTEQLVRDRSLGNPCLTRACLVGWERVGPAPLS